jgi:hypothetical protein
MRSERLAAFIFRLARDEIPTGKIEEHVRVVCKAHTHGGRHAETGEGVVYEPECAHIGEWAQEVADRLLDGLGEEHSDRDKLAKVREIILAPYTIGGQPGQEDDTGVQRDAIVEQNHERITKVAKVLGLRGIATPVEWRGPPR